MFAQYMAESLLILTIIEVIIFKPYSYEIKFSSLAKVDDPTKVPHSLENRTSK